MNCLHSGNLCAEYLISVETNVMNLVNKSVSTLEEIEFCIDQRDMLALFTWSDASQRILRIGLR